MRRPAILFLIFLVCLLFTTGCWSRRELNDLAIVAAIGIDRVENKVQVSVQVVDPGEVAAQRASSGRAPVTMYHAKGDTVFEAIRKMTTVTPRKLYFAHLRIFVLSEEVAREGIGKILDLFSRDHEIRTDFFMVVSKGAKAKDVLNVLTPLEKIPATKMFTSLEVSEKSWAPTVAVQLDELITDLVSEGKHAVLTGIRIQGDPQASKGRQNIEQIDAPSFLQYDGIAVFRKDKLVGWLNEDESKGYSDLTDKLKSTVIEIACPSGGRMGVEVIRSKSKVKGQVKNGKPEVEVTVHTEANIADVECEIDLTKTKTIYEIEKKVEQVMKENAKLAVSKAKKLQSDVLGFGDAIHRRDPVYWKKVKKNWNKEFSQVRFKMNVDVKIRRLGTISESFVNKLKE
ncbi:spore germination protein KC [Brevibacillus reuszeri]|uniref:Spore germination protein KC n=1 Tax=Brevibacillus reuszeri TaxID=54915 RepID=A0A0K9YYK3_9BACL|nr:Ger(x)C family spore germination protein [Brevibacillus reuszeri]KNB73808.1 spore gernimation protein GerC [Brevibacillus reuszeri]MED1860047.1 Ger(x)C family spore germination protein [Brevibacillus reuszeri]GED71124.1 spore germination protein KC [Brevibacillus reuszeri]